jgi:hypothetical protein
MGIPVLDLGQKKLWHADTKRPGGRLAAGWIWIATIRG